MPRWKSLVVVKLLFHGVCAQASPQDSIPRLAVSEEADLIFDQATAECESVSQAAFLNEPTVHQPDCAHLKARGWQMLPDGLLFRSYLAGPHEPRVSLVGFRDSDNGKFLDATVGARIGLLRYGTTGAARPSGWQWDFEGGVITRLNVRQKQDVESMDYRFGTLITAAEGDWAIKFGYFHISSHVGDEYVVRNPTFERINYVTESWIVGGSYKPTSSTRFYAEFANAFSTSGGAQRYQIQTGAEYTPIAKVGERGAPFAAVNFDLREAVDYDATTTLQVGWSFLSEESARRLRFGLEYGNGPTSQFEFFMRREKYLGVGIWFDF